MDSLNLQGLLLIPRIIEASLFLIVIFLLNRKYQCTPFRTRPMVYKLFHFAFIGWFVYIFCDIFIYSTAHLSFDPLIPIRVEGYSLDYPSLLIANILRDIAFTGYLLEVFCYFFVPFAIRLGETKVRQILRNKFMLILIIGTMIMIVTNDIIIVQIEIGKIVITENWNEITGFSIAMTIGLYMSAAFHISKVLKTVSKEENMQNYRKKLNYLRFGIFFMGFGYIWTITFNILAIIFGLVDNIPLFLFVSIALHTFWTISPIAIYLGLIYNTPESPPND